MAFRLEDNQFRVQEKNPSFSYLYTIQASKDTPENTDVFSIVTLAFLTLIRPGSSKKNLEILKALQLKKV